MNGFSAERKPRSNIYVVTATVPLAPSQLVAQARCVSLIQNCMHNQFVCTGQLGTTLTTPAAACEQSILVNFPGA